MPLPITHYLYLALALFCVGLGGALLRRSLVVVLLSIELMLAAVALLVCAYARFFGDAGGQLAALAVVLVGLVELAVAAAVIVRIRLTLRGASLRAAFSRSGIRGQGDDSVLDDWTREGGPS